MGIKGKYFRNFTSVTVGVELRGEVDHLSKIDEPYILFSLYLCRKIMISTLFLLVKLGVEKTENSPKN